MDGQQVWFAAGDKLNAFDPASRKTLLSIDVAAHVGTAFDGQHFARLPTPSFTEEVRNQNSGVTSCRSCRICEQGLYSKIRERHLPGKISTGIPDSLAPELLQLLNSEFWNVESDSG